LPKIAFLTRSRFYEDSEWAALVAAGKAPRHA
jgi:hypothetical protein